MVDNALNQAAGLDFIIFKAGSRLRPSLNNSLPIFVYCTPITDGAQLLLFRSAISVDLHTNLGNKVHAGGQSAGFLLR